MSTETAEAGVVVDVEAPPRPLPPLPAHWRSPARAWLHVARSDPKRPALADSTGASLTYGDLLMRAVALGRVLGRSVGPGRYVGVLLPPTVPAIVANLALHLQGKTPINLNYTAGREGIEAAIEQCKITHVLTSRRVLDKFKIELPGNVLMLEDLAKQVTKADKVAAGAARVLPIGLLGLLLPGLRGDRLDDTATIVFTSGSTGEPKGVVLSNRNVLSNVHQIQIQVDLRPGEVVIGILPLFHSFGYTVTLWAVLTLGLKGVYHFSPLDARIIGNLIQEHRATIILSTPTFMRGLIQRCDREQFATMKLPILGAEKLKPELAQAIRDGLGIEPLEGYGCTETGPVASVNTPLRLTTPDGRTVDGNKPGTVGMPMPGTRVKTVDPETGANLPRGTEGLVYVKGPQVMVGYLDRPEATAKVLKDGWYNTGDLGLVDEDGFLRITDRLSRFSKIGGEMVPHQKVEAALVEAAGAADGVLAVSSRPDPKRGERLVVVHTDGLGVEPAELVRRLNAGPIPKLWVPGAEDFVRVEALPLLGTGKLDLRQLRALAREPSPG